MGRLLGVSREWVSKLENGREDVSEFVMLKLAKLEGETSAGNVKKDHIAREDQAPYGGLEREVRLLFEEVITAAAGDPGRLGWVREQLLSHLQVPVRWTAPSAPSPLIERARREARQGADHSRSVASEEAG